MSQSEWAKRMPTDVLERDRDTLLKNIKAGQPDDGTLEIILKELEKRQYEELRKKRRKRKKKQ
jgi:hypothetical protein